MKKSVFGILLGILLLSLIGCEDDEDKAYRLTFENASRYTVHVIPLTTEWGGFSLAPGEKVELKDIRDVDYRFEPDTVQEGSASTKRYIIFVDAEPE